MNYIALPIGFYCETGRNKQTTSLRFATGFSSWKDAQVKAQEVQRELNLTSFTIICSLEGDKAK